MRVPKAAFEDLLVFVLRVLLFAVVDVEVVLLVVLVVTSPVVPAAAAGPAASPKNAMEIAASRRQPVTAFEYDKPTHSLSCAYGVSCRARAERVSRYVAFGGHDSPQEPLSRLIQLVPPLWSETGRTRLGWVCWRGA